MDALKVNISPSHMIKMKTAKHIFVLLETTKHMDSYMPMIKEVVKYLFKSLEGQEFHIIRFASTFEYVYGLADDNYQEVLDGIGFVTEDKDSKQGFADALDRCKTIIENGHIDGDSVIIVFGKGDWVEKTEQDYENTVFADISSLCGDLETKNKFIGFLLGKDAYDGFGDLVSKHIDSIYRVESNFYHQIKQYLNQCSCPLYVEATPNDYYSYNCSYNLKFKVIPRDNTMKYENVAVKVYRDDGSFVQEKSSEIVSFEQPFYKSIDTGLKEPKRIKFSLIIDDDQEYEGEIEPHISWFLRNLLFNPQVQYIIGFFGLRGVGKSTTINGIFNLFSCQNRIFEKNIAGFLSDHVTTGINKTMASEILDWFNHPLAQEYKKLIGDMTIIDAPGHEIGVENINVTTVEVDQMTEQFKLDSIIIPFSLQNSNKEEIAYINESVKKLRAKDISPILVLTFADKISKQEIEETKRSLMNDLNFHSNDVFELVNYSDELYRNFDKDVTLFNIFSRAIKNSQVCKDKKKVNQK